MACDESDRRDPEVNEIYLLQGEERATGKGESHHQRRHGPNEKEVGAVLGKAPQNSAADPQVEHREHKTDRSGQRAIDPGQGEQNQGNHRGENEPSYHYAPHHGKLDHFVSLPPRWVA